MNFLEATRVTEVTGGPVEGGEGAPTRRRFDVTIPDGWQQGAGAFGGLVLAVLVRAIEAGAPGRPLRSLTAEIPAPVQPGGATIVVEVLRAGKSVTVLAARLLQGGELFAHAVGTVGVARALPGLVDSVDLTPPTAPGWRDLPPIPPGLPNIPRFAQHFEFRLADGAPFRGAPKSGATGWIRLREPGPVKDAALVVAHVDAWWPAEFARFVAPRPMVTAAFSLQMVGGASAWTTAAPLLHTSRTLAQKDGYATELRELWSEEGELLALNQQTMVVVK